MMKAKTMMVAVAAASLTGACTSDPNTYTATPDEMAQTMVGKTSSFMQGNTKHAMRVTGGSAKGVSVELLKGGKSDMACRIQFEPVDESTTRVVPNCGEVYSITGEARVGNAKFEITQHAKQILTGEPVDVALIINAQTIRAAKNMPKVQKRALQMDAEMRNIQNQHEADKRESAAAAEGWGSAN